MGRKGARPLCAFDKTHTHQKKTKEEDTELEYEPEDCIGPKRDPADWNATDEHGNPPF